MEWRSVSELREITKSRAGLDGCTACIRYRSSSSFGYATQFVRRLRDVLFAPV